MLSYLTILTNLINVAICLAWWPGCNITTNVMHVCVSQLIQTQTETAHQWNPPPSYQDYVSSPTIDSVPRDGQIIMVSIHQPDINKINWLLLLTHSADCWLQDRELVKSTWSAPVCHCFDKLVSLDWPPTAIEFPPYKVYQFKQRILCYFYPRKKRIREERRQLVTWVRLIRSR